MKQAQVLKDAAAKEAARALKAKDQEVKDLEARIKQIKNVRLIFEGGYAHAPAWKETREGGRGVRARVRACARTYVCARD